jgi:hypothetical protein
MNLNAYLYRLALEHFDDDEDEAQEFCDTNVYSNELSYQLYSGRFDIQPELVIFDGQCHPEDGSKVFYNRGEDTLYYLVNWEQY